MYKRIFYIYFKGTHIPNFSLFIRKCIPQLVIALNLILSMPCEMYKGTFRHLANSDMWLITHLSDYDCLWISLLCLLLTTSTPGERQLH